MPRFEPGLTFTPSPQAIATARERLHRAGFPVSEAAARDLVEAVLAIEGPRMLAVARGILHGSLETIRQTAEVALAALRESRSERPDLVGVVKQHLRAEPGPSQQPRDEHRPAVTRNRHEEEDDRSAEGDARPVFKRPRGR
jgi:hypothetical protein